MKLTFCGLRKKIRVIISINKKINNNKVFK